MHLENIIRQAGKKDRKAQSELYDEFGALWYSICLRYAGSKEDAQDTLQNALVKIYTQIKKFDPQKGSFKSWSAKIVVNENLMWLRKHKKDQRKVSVEYDYDLEDNNLSAMDIISAKELTKMIQSLPDGYRNVFNMFVVEGFSHEEIAAELKISVGTSKSQLFKAKQYLRQKLEVLI